MRFPLLIAGAGLAVALVAVYSSRVHQHTEATEHIFVSLPFEDPTEWGSRPQYPYSVKPGGIINEQEFQAAKQEGIVADHYAGIEHLGALQITSEDQWKYVSYRYGGAIYWTKSKRHLPVSEAVWISASGAIRMRCGNRLSDIPQTPTLPPAEEKPIIEAMGGIDDHSDSNDSGNAPSKLASSLLNVAGGFPLVLPPLPSVVPGSAGYTVPILPLYRSGIYEPLIIPERAAVVVATPEPKTWILAILGTVFLMAVLDVWRKDGRGR